MHKNEIDKYLLNCDRFQDFAQHIFNIQLEDFVLVLLDEMVRSQSAVLRGNTLFPTASHDTLTPNWIRKHIQPKDWICN